nr:putative ribonuclease H-like domain-containing protein [Tanacetum cinerariifolium]
MEQLNPTFSKILILDIGKFKQWKFKIQQYLQNKHYALWEVIEFGDSYEAPQEESGTGSASESSAKKKGRTVAITTEDMQKRRNDTFGGNEATKKTKKNQLKQQYGNFKAEGSETLGQTFNRLHAIVSHLEFMDVKIEQDDLNQKFLTSLAPEWLMYTIVWRNRNDLDTLSLDDVYNHLKVYEPKVQKKLESNSQNMAFISSANTSSGKGEVNTASIPTASTQVSPTIANVAAASISHDTVCAYIASQSNGSQIKYEDINQIDEDDIEEMDIKAPRSQDRGRREIYKQGSKVEESAPKALMATDREVRDLIRTRRVLDTVLFPPPVQVYSPPKKDMSWTRLPDFADDTITDYSRPSPSIESNSSDLQNSNSFVSEHGESSESIMSKPIIKFVKEADSPTVIKTNKVETVRKPYVKYAEMYRNTSKSPKGNSQNNIDDKGYWDSGCSRHMTGNISYLSDYEPYDEGYVSFRQGGGKITSKGIIKTGKLEVENVYFVKDLKYNLFSVSQICDNKNSVFVTGSECIVLRRDFKLKDDTNVLLRTHRQHNMYSINLNNIVPHKDLTYLVAKVSADESMLWHRRLCHLNYKTMNKLVRHNLVKGLPSKCFENDHTCVACLKGKQHKASCKTKLVNSVSKPLHTLHMDLFGPTSDETSGILRNFITEIQNLKDLEVKIIRNKTLIETARTMLADAKLPVTLWVEAVNTACYVQNMVLVNKSQNKTPYELFNSITPAIGFLRPFGCHVMILNTLDHLGKFDAKGDEGYFVGYSMSSKAFRVFNKSTKKVEENLHVDFLENKLIEKGVGPNWLFDIDTLTNSMNYFPVVVAGTSSTNFSGTKDAASQDVKKDVSSLRYIALPNWFHKAHLESSISNAQDACNADALESNDSPEPSSTTRLISKRVTSQDETPSLDNISTLSNRFEGIRGVTTNTGVRPIGTKWVLKNKKDERGIMIKNKARLVAQGHTQEEGIDYEEVFAPVVRIEAIRLFLAYASFMGFTVYQMNVKSAFLYGTINEEVYVMQPPGFQDPEFPDRFYKVEKAMYGLHQAPRAWYGTLSKYLLANGFQRGTTDQTLFIRKHRGDFLLVQVYVDDIIFGSSNPLLCREFEALMHDKLQMSDMGELNFFLGLQVLQQKDGIFLSQDKYVGDILKKFGYSDVRSANTPMDKENPWGKDGPGKDVDLHLYRSMIGSLMYLTRIFRYLKGHPKMGLWYHKESPFDLVAYSDSDYGGATQDRKSTTGGCQFLGRRLISWQCKKQTIMATSTTEAEYVATASGCGQVPWIQNQLLDYGLAFCDYYNMIAILEKSEHNVDFHSFGPLQRSKQRMKEQRFSILLMGESSGTPTEPHHTPSPEAHQSPHHDLSSSLHPTETTETIPKHPLKSPYLGNTPEKLHGLLSPKLFPLLQMTGQDRENIIKTSAFPYDSTPRVASLDADEGSMQQQLKELANRCTRLQRQQTEMATKIAARDLEISSLKARIKLLEDKDKGTAELSGDDAPIKGKSLETKEEAGVEKSTERGSNDTEELVNVLTSMDAVNILTSGVQAVNIPSVAEVSTVGIPTGSGLVPTVSAIFTTASVVTPYSRRKGKEKMVESDTPKKKNLQEQIDVQMAREMEEQMAREDQRMDEQIARDAKIARIHAEEELKMLIDGLDRNNEVIAKHLQEYEKSEVELTIGEKIDLINELVKYQDHHAKILKYQAQQSKPLSKKEQREFYMSVLKSHSGWKTKHFRGMTLEQIREKFIPVWKQIEDFVPMASKEEGERVKMKGLKLQQGSAKKMKTSEDVSEEDLKEMMQLVPMEEVYVEALQVKHPIVDWGIHTEGKRDY